MGLSEVVGDCRIDSTSTVMVGEEGYFAVSDLIITVRQVGSWKSALPSVTETGGLGLTATTNARDWKLTTINCHYETD